MESEANSCQEVITKIYQKRLATLQNPQYEVLNPETAKVSKRRSILGIASKITVVDWLKVLEGTLKWCEVDPEMWGKMFIDFVKDKDKTFLQSLKVNEGEWDFEVYRKAFVRFHFPKENLPSFEISQSLNNYILNLQELIAIRNIPNEPEIVKVVVDDSYENKLISHKMYTSLHEVVQELEEKLIQDTVVEKTDKSNTLVMSVKLLLEVPTDIWKLILRSTGVFKRKASLSLLLSCSSMRKHLLPLFYIQSCMNLKEIFEGCYSMRKQDDEEYFLKLEKESYLKIEVYFEKTIQTEGNWKVNKKDLSNDSYAIEIQLEELKSNITWCNRSQKEIDRFQPTLLNLNPKPIPRLIFSRFPKIEFPVDNNNKILKISQKAFENKKAPSNLSLFYQDIPSTRLQRPIEICMDMFHLIPKTIPNYSEILYQTPSLLRAIAQKVSGLKSSNLQRDIYQYQQNKIIEGWVAISPTLSPYLPTPIPVKLKEIPTTIPRR
eukprot:TRINITY_DN19526_c0_g1_i1.p1 TRINITY_DN19526_c0_g1~~TRINITY_DN19526_c0_g1_i1.p1  ORF type:complete len:491 (+),score=126.67 TRINITY_DN19526_c0_g1_i1:93-1565(+)